MSETEQLDEITFEAGQIVKIDGIPFELKEETTLLGRKENLELISKESGQVFRGFESSD